MSEGRRDLRGVSRTYLIVDTRERGVTPFLDSELKLFAYVEKQINTGDYLVCRAGPHGEPKILACIERKTLEDFAASFKDARYENRKKMMDLRARTGCQLYFFVEGPAFPSPDRRFARIPYASILAAATKLMVRDGIFVVQTADQHHTAKRLADFLHAFDTEDAPAPFLAGSGAGAGAGAGAEDASAGGDVAGEGPAGLAVPEALLTRLEPSDADASLQMWARLRGISVVLAKILSREFSIAELIRKGVSPQRIQELKTATGRKINKDAADSLLALRSGSMEHSVKVLSGLRNVTPATARVLIVAANGLARLCSYTVPTIAMITLPQKGRSVKLGEVRAARIHRLLHFKDGESPGVAEASDVSPDALSDVFPDTGVGVADEKRQLVTLTDDDLEEVLGGLM